MIKPDAMQQVLAANGWESLLVVVAIMVFSGAVNLIKRLQGKRGGASWEDESQHAPQKPPSSSWEVELRRMLQEDPRQTAPPVFAPLPQKAPTLKPTPLFASEEEAPATPPLVQLTQSATAYDRAAALHERIAAHLQQVDERTESGRPDAPTPHTKKRPAEAEAAVALLKQLNTARQAVIASIILGPPKALES